MTVPDERQTLTALLRHVTCLLLDFDGPVCSVFAAVDTRHLADKIRANLVGYDLPDPIRTTDDPLVVMQHAQTLDRATARRAEATLTAEEINAVRSAKPTPGAHAAIRVATSTGRRVGIVSNNSRAAIQANLDAYDLTVHITVIAARTPDNAHRLKPHPDLLLAALAQLDTKPEDAVFVGDSPSDIVAAHAANVTVIGYANKPGKHERLSDQDPTHIITAMDDLALALMMDGAEVDP
jgi:HAD superfamily hydrolase (TIGR01509 family)